MEKVVKMKKNYIVKAVLDTLMLLTFCLLMNTRFLGMTFHEVAGLAIGGAVLYHLIINRNWITGISKNLFSGKLPKLSLFKYVLNAALFIDFAIILVTGILMSRVLFPNLGLPNIPAAKSLHTLCSYIGIVLIGVHLGLHAGWVKGVFAKSMKKLFGGRSLSPAFGKILRPALLALVLGLGLWQVVETDFVSRLNPVAASTHGHMKGERPQMGQSSGAAFGENNQGGKSGRVDSEIKSNSGKASGLEGGKSGRGGHGAESISVSGAVTNGSQFMIITIFIAVLTALIAGAGKVLFQNKKRKVIQTNG